jgi:hypothetical protein
MSPSQWAVAVTLLVVVACSEDSGGGEPAAKSQPTGLAQEAVAPHFAVVADGSGARLLVSFSTDAKPETVILMASNEREADRQSVVSGVAVFLLASMPESISAQVIWSGGATTTHEWRPE